jgi:anti-anti-sigma factor
MKRKNNRLFYFWRNAFGKKEDYMNVEFTKKGDIGVVSIFGRLIVSNAKVFKESFEEITEKANFVVLDLSEMEYIDSMGLGSIISLYKALQELDGDLCIANLQSKPKTLFQITKVYLIFDVFETLDEALASMQKKFDLRVH